MRKEDTVKLISAEGFEFVISKEAAMVSQTIRNMLTSPGSFAEAQHGEVTFPEISTTILEKICQYFHWSLQYARFGFLSPFSFVDSILHCVVSFKIVPCFSEVRSYMNVLDWFALVEFTSIQQSISLTKHVVVFLKPMAHFNAGISLLLLS
ncbi:unnamed protein product [Linum tenue]|uniref:Elongin-C n=1 Tax=Linum tenue TaxID=586396 RepID=A0AAV0L4P6_9ROSI|nr:unnamed protein product [Linum tenue]